MRSKKLNIPTLVLTCFLVGCDSGEFSDPPLEYQGYLTFFRSDDTVRIYANFVKQTIQIPTSDFQTHWIQTDDNCTVQTLDLNRDPEQQNNQDSAVPPDIISVGETIVITSEFGTFATLPRSASYPHSYSTELSQGTVPANLSLDIPSDEFPAFPNITIPQTPAVEFTPLDGNDVTRATAFEWVTNNNPFSVISITAFDHNLLTGFSTEVRCTVVDDGSFSFPEDIQAQMGDEFASPRLYIDRRTTSFLQHDDALLIITTGW